MKWANQVLKEQHPFPSSSSSTVRYWIEKDTVRPSPTTISLDREPCSDTLNAVTFKSIIINEYVNPLSKK